MTGRGAVALLVAVLLVAPAIAQVRGVPPSITSYGPSRSFTPGIPASITSLGPNGYGGPCSSFGALIPSAMGCTDPQFTAPYYGNPQLKAPFNLKPHRRGGAYPVYIPYSYPYPVVTEPPVVVEQPAEEEAEPPAPTVFEHRARVERPPAKPAPAETASADESRYGTHYLDGRESQPAPAARPHETAPEQPPVLLIYRDGHEREVKNYAIVGNTLYDLGMFVAAKIPLAQLNLKATIKANEDRGVDFTLPASIKLD
jgi:hypothetical protein